jgi:ABC-type lipoprotein export system ATPase subunit
VVKNLHSEPCIELRHIKKSFRGPHGQTEILKDLSFSLFPQDSVGINGVSGAGKSTFLNILAALERPDAGEVLWNGESIHAWSLKKIARFRALHIGFVFQSCHLIPELDVLENLLLTYHILKGHVDFDDRKRARDILERLGMTPHSHQLPMTLSGGERQRVAIARAFIHHPRVIVADEPTGNLDEASGEQVMRLLEEMQAEEHTALLLVTHHMPFSQRMRHQCRLHQGILESL